MLAGQFYQFLADNMEHNAGTLDGMNTFHCMGIIQTIPPGSSKSYIILHKNIKAVDIEKHEDCQTNFTTLKVNLACISNTTFLTQTTPRQTGK